MSAPKTAITPTRQENFAEWYQEVIKAADLAEHSAVRGCMIIKPWGYAIWEFLQKALDKMIKDTGHQNVYFPMLIPVSYLEKEAAHVEGFAKECAIVTHYRLEGDGTGKLIPSPDAELAEPFVIRPTSETIIGTAMAKWVQSYNDLPVLINQWCNVMRWEMRTRLFLRTTEFLWQEGHTAHADAKEAQAEAHMMLNVYEELAANHLAIPVIKGEKTASERFPGAVNTFCIEAMMQDGKALQAGTSHFLGQNFSTAYDIKFTDKNQQSSYAWTTSWGVTTRLIGALIMTHSDDDGLVLPPRVAPEQIVLIPFAMNDEDQAIVYEYCDKLALEIRKLHFHDEPVRVFVDKSAKRAGEKFWSAVKKGIPLRVEIGKREIEAGTISLTRRDKPAKEKTTLKREEFLTHVTTLLKEIQYNLLERAKTYQAENTREVKSLSELEQMFKGDEDKKIGFALAYFDTNIESQDNIVEKMKSLKITTRCIPFSNDDSEGTCIFSGKKIRTKVIFARAY